MVLKVILRDLKISKAWEMTLGYSESLVLSIPRDEKVDLMV